MLLYRNLFSAYLNAFCLYVIKHFCCYVEICFYCLNVYFPSVQLRRDSFPLWKLLHLNIVLMHFALVYSECKNKCTRPTTSTVGLSSPSSLH